MSADSDAAVPTTSTPLPLYDECPLPAGWLKRVDERTNCPFYVDTLGRPPHSIWVFPLDDPDYLRKTGQIYPDEEQVLAVPPPPAYPVDERIRPSRPSDEDDLNADSSEPPPPPPEPEPTEPTSSVETTEASTPPYAAVEKGSSAANPNPSPSSPSASESGPSNSKGKKATIFSKLKGKSNSKANLTLAERETKRESEAKAYYIQREVMLAKRKEESSDADFARLLTRPYQAPLPSDYGGPKYKPPVHKAFGEKLSGVADGAFNLLFGSSWPERYGDQRGSWR